MPVVPFVPLIGAGISGVSKLLGNRKKGSSGADQLAAQQASLANQQAAQSAQLFRAGMPLVNQSGNYWGRILGGDRATMRASVAPEASEITDLYKGAERNLERSNLVGPARDYAAGELARERTGRIASLIPLARRAAAGEGANLGTTLLGEGRNNLSSASSTLGSLVEGQRKQDAYNNEQSYNFGQNLAGLVTDVYKAWPRKGDSGASGFA